MKKIIHIAQSAGGVAEYLYMLLKNFDNENYENILVVSEDYKKQINRFKNITKKIYFIPMIREIKLKEDLRAIKQVKKILKIEKPDIVYLHSSKAGAIGRIALLFNKKIKIVYNAHGWYFNADIASIKKNIFSFIEKILALKTEKIINISQSEYDSAIKYKIAKPSKMCIIENGIDFNKFKNNKKYRKETRCKYGIKEDEKLIGVVGRITEQKDPMTSIKAFNLLHKGKKNIKFMFIGDGERKNDILEYARQNNIENDIIVTGWVKEVEKYIPALDVAILPSKWEGFGLVLIEYMACNKPIVATNIGGISNIIKDGVNGYLVEVENYKQLSEKINYVLENEKEVKKIIENNKKYCKKYSMNICRKKVLYVVESFGGGLQHFKGFNK